MSGDRILIAISSILILMLFFVVNCTAQNNSNCAAAVASSSSSIFCGNIKISYPFSLKTSPKSCGYEHPSFELECRNNNETIIKVRSRKYIVQDINYVLYSIRVVDPSINRANLSSCPVYSNDYDSWPGVLNPSFFYDLNIPVYLIYCLGRVNNSKYVEGPFCGNRSSMFSTASQIYSYLTVGDIVSTVSDVEDSCNLYRVVWSSKHKEGRSNDSSLEGIYEHLSYGVELSWFRTLCGECDKSDGYCSLEDGNDSRPQVTCKHYCKEDQSIKTFKCRMEYYLLFVSGYGTVAVCTVIAVRILIGIIVVIGLMVFIWRRRRYLHI